MKTQTELCATFEALHEREGAFVIPNPWDVGSARVLAGMGFAALATTSSGFAYGLGKRDGGATRTETLDHVRALVANVDVPVNADLANAFGDAPEVVAETFRMAVDAGVAGASVEDASGDEARPIYDFELAVERVRAAVEVVRSSGIAVLVTARAENYLHGRTDLDDTIKRLQAYEEAGADVLYAPGIRTREEIAAVCSSVGRPVNVLAGLPGMELNVPELAELGVKRVSTGGLLSRAAIGALLRAGKDLREGSFAFAAEAANFRDVAEWLE